MKLLLEQLKSYDEVTILELLEISTEDLLERFKDKVYAKRVYLSREIEVLEEDEEGEDDLDGFQVEDIYKENDDD